MWEALAEATKAFVLNNGYGGIFLLTTVEQFIFPLPADPLIGAAAGSGLVIWKIILMAFLASIVGSSIGYFLGRKLGHPVAEWLFGKKKLDKVEAYIKKWGFWAVIIVGTTPIPFKLVTWGAGVFEMPFKKYILGVIIGRMPRYILSAYAGRLIIESKLLEGESLSAIILGALQGFTEFLPISSSGHLVIMQSLLPDLPLSVNEMVTFDVFLHGGSLIAILLYFWKDWVAVLKEIGGMIKHLKFKKSSLTSKLILGTIPAIITALLFEGLISEKLRNLTTVAIFFIVVGVIYFYTAWRGRWNYREKITHKKALWIGLAQALALIPGVSRAGSTIAAGVTLGLKREAAAKFSFMLGAIAILAANVYSLLKLAIESFKPVGSISEIENTVLPSLNFILTGTITSFLTSLAGIYLLMHFLKKYSMRAFGVYLILAGTTILSLMPQIIDLIETN